MNRYDIGMLLLPTENGLLFLDRADIIRIEASSNYSKIFCKGKTCPVVVAKVLRWFEEQSSLVSFIRIHRTHLINPQHIRSYRSRNGLLLLQNDETFPVSRRRKPLIKQHLNRIRANYLSLPYKLLTNKTIAA